MTFPAGAQLRKYQIVQQLGAGAFGEVYEARDAALNEICAVKFIPLAPGTLPGPVLQEAQHIRACASQHIVSVRDADIISFGGFQYVAISMEYLPQGSLATAVEGAGISLLDAMTASRHVLLGLAAAHHAGIIHRDVKPANIMIAGADFKLSDFGISNLKAAVGGNALVYTPNAAPECIVGGHIGDEVSDIYSVGVTMHRLCQLQGNIAVSPARFAAWQAAGPRVGLPEFLGFPEYLPRRLKTVIKKATAVDRAARYQTAEEILVALEALRVEIPWRKDGPLSWCADADKQHQLVVQADRGRWALNFLRNGRRKKEECEHFPTEDAARRAAARKIASTLLVG